MPEDEHKEHPFARHDMDLLKAHGYIIENGGDPVYIYEFEVD